MFSFFSAYLLPLMAMMLITPAIMKGLQEDYPTNSVRTDRVESNCRKSRIDLIQTEKNHPSIIAALSATQRATKIRWYQLNYPTLEQLQGKIIAYSLFLSIGWGIMFFSCCCLSCCVARPECCKSCAPLLSEQYRKFFAAAIFVLSLLVFSTMVAAGPFSFDKTYGDLLCGHAIVFDDLLNGNVSADGSHFFMGLSRLKKELSAFENGTLQQIASVVSSGGEIMKEIQADFNSALKSVETVPSINGLPLTLDYPSPINSSSDFTMNVSSQLPAILGTVSDNSTKVGAIALTLEKAKRAISSVSSNADSTQKKLDWLISEAILTLDSRISEAKERDKDSLSPQFQDLFSSSLRSFFVIYYIVIVGSILLCALAVLATIQILRKQFKFRFLLYVVYVGIIIWGLLSFSTAISSSASTALSCPLCLYLKHGLDSSSSFSAVFDFMLGYSLSQELSACLLSGDGRSIEDYIDETVVQFLSDSTIFSTNLNKINGNAISQSLKDSINGFSSTIADYQAARILDIDPSSADVAALVAISAVGAHGCTSNTADSWIPSVNQVTEYVRCLSPSRNKATSKECTQNFSERIEPCSGCMDTYDIFKQKTSKEDVTAALNQRYPNCTQFSSSLGNIWQNYYKVKKDKLSPVITSAQSMETSITALSDRIANELVPVFKDTRSKMSSSFGKSLSPTRGIVAGLNCHVIGEDLQLFVNILCNHFFYRSYVLRILFSISSFCMLLMMFCTAIMGMGAYLDQQLIPPAENMKNDLPVQDANAQATESPQDPIGTYRSLQGPTPRMDDQ